MALALAFTLGLGYGVNDLCWQTVDGRWLRLSDHSYRGLEATLGTLLSFGPVSLSAELLSTQFKTLECKAGIGVNF